MPNGVSKQIIQVGGGGTPNWGDIGGNIGDQTDLQTALSGKSDTTHNHDGVYEPADSTILKDVDIGVTVASQAHEHTGVYEPANVNIQSHISSTSNPHSVTKTQVGLGNVANVDTTTTANITDSTNKRFVTDSQQTVINNTSGTNTGDRNDECFGITVDGAGTAITTGSKGYRTIPYACTITGWELSGKESGDIVFDVKKCNYTGFPTTASIAGTEKPTLSTAQKNRDLALSTWGTSLVAGDIIEFVVDSASTITRATLTIFVTKV